jgi:DNA modification methylase
MDAESIDAVVTDPPYELGFMGKAWDASGVAFQVETWQAVLRVLKPGGHLLAFGGTRTYHRMTCAIEDAGFEVRDCLQWIYGSGFPTAPRHPAASAARATRTPRSNRRLLCGIWSS